MSIDLSNFLDKTISSMHVSDNIDLKDFKANGRKIKFVEPVHFEGDIYKVEGENFLTGNIVFKYIENCARCLKEFPLEIEAALSGKLVERSKKNRENLDDEYGMEDNIIYYEGEHIDLTDAIMATIILSLPMKALCNDDCKGLCPKCGKNLNKGDCDCNYEEIDPRMAKLKDLLK
jgi:uncharacterized protein